MKLHQCRCFCCRHQSDKATCLRHREINLLMNRMSGANRRLYSAMETRTLGRGGIKAWREITGLSSGAIRRGQKELASLLSGEPNPVPRGHPGRYPIERKYPDICSVLEALLHDDSAGDPMSLRKWTRISSRKLSKKLAEIGYSVNYHTLCRLLKQMGYSLKVNVRHRASTAYAPKRDSQFNYIAAQKAKFLASGRPVISVDAKKKELIGNFKAAGSVWRRQAIKVDQYTFELAPRPSVSPRLLASTMLERTRVTSGLEHLEIPQPSPYLPSTNGGSSQDVTSIPTNRRFLFWPMVAEAMVYAAGRGNTSYSMVSAMLSALP